MKRSHKRAALVGACYGVLYLLAPYPFDYDFPASLVALLMKGLIAAGAGRCLALAIFEPKGEKP